MNWAVSGSWALNQPPCKGKSFTEELHARKEKGSEEEKETLTGSETRSRTVRRFSGPLESYTHEGLFHFFFHTESAGEEKQGLFRKPGRARNANSTAAPDHAGSPIQMLMSPRTKAATKSAKTAEVVIPEKLYFRIGEVARLCRLPAYVLRFWETEFPQLKPVKSSTGQRMYRRKDVEGVLRIKRLLYEEGFTIAGARQQLRSEVKGPDKKQAPLPFPAHASTDLKHIRQGLREILTMLSPRT